jgi:phosphonate transport system substrate-binding protein
MRLKKTLIYVVSVLLIHSAQNSSYAASGMDDSLKVGIFPRRNLTETIRKFSLLTEYLAKKLKRDVVLIPTKTFDAFWQGIENEKFDLVHYNQYHYIKSHKEYGYRVILMNEEFGRETIAGALISTTRSGIKSVADLKGKTIIFGGGRDAMQSYILATYLLNRHGLQAGDYREQFALNPLNAVFASYYGEGAAAGAGDQILSLPGLSKKLDTSRLTYLAVGEQLPHLPWAVRGNLEPALIEKIKTTLLGLAQDAEGKKILKKAELTGLHSANDRDYDVHRKIVKEVLGENY